MAIEEIAETAIGWGFLCQKKIKPYYLTFLGYEIEMAKTKTETSSITIPNLQKKKKAISRGAPVDNSVSIGLFTRDSCVDDCIQLMQTKVFH